MTRDWEQLLAESIDDVQLPSSVYDEARRAHRRHRSIVLTGAATSVLAVAALTAALVLPAANRSSDPQARGSQAGTSGPTLVGQAPVTGRRLLLAAADVAATRPNTTGRYWHTVYTTRPRGEATSRLEQWTDRNGVLYLAVAGHASAKGRTPGGFELAGIATVLSAHRLSTLPTDPGALVGYLNDAWSQSFVSDGRSVDERGTDVEVALISLLADVPSPPAVRAAAFRALAQSPNVDPEQSAGNTVVLTGFGLPESKTGRPLTPEADRFSITVDPVTSRLIRTVSYSDTETYLVAEWTNTLP